MPINSCSLIVQPMCFIPLLSGLSSAISDGYFSVALKRQPQLSRSDDQLTSVASISVPSGRRYKMADGMMIYTSENGLIGAVLAPNTNER